MGSIQIADKEIGVLTIECDAGNIILNCVSAENVKLSNKMGSVMIDSSTGVKTTDI